MGTCNETGRSQGLGRKTFSNSLVVHGMNFRNNDRVLFIFCLGLLIFSFPSFISGGFLMLDLDKFQDIIIHKIPRGRAGSCSITMFHFKLSQVKGKKNTMPCHWNLSLGGKILKVLLQRLCVGIMS